MSHIELAAPCCLTLAAGRLHGRPALVGLALRHPPVQLEAHPAPSLTVTGARADAAYRCAARLQAARALGGARIEIELAIPSYMGLGSDALTGLAAAQALAALHGQQGGILPADAGLTPDDGLAAHAFAVGGLLAVGADGALLRRTTLPNTDEARDWVFVCVLPRVPPGTPADLEDVRRRELWATGPGAPAETLTAELWRAAEEQDLPAFAAHLLALQALGPAPELGEGERTILAVMRAGGALACGRAPTGLALYALVRGAEASRELRHALSRTVGYTGGIVMASICDATGARFRLVS